MFQFLRQEQITVNLILGFMDLKFGIQLIYILNAFPLRNLKKI